ncbi:MAG: hypothetical protein LBJ04_03930 [Sphingobacterium sp.]|jgi:hypothetical protein|nr:hypothetical protein [Sphingobacterium sp.]
MIDQNEILEKIKESLPLSSIQKGKLSNSLFTGGAGILLFYALEMLTTEENYLNEDFEQSLVILCNRASEYSTASFCNGYAGFLWLLDFFKKNNILDEAFDLNIYSDQLHRDLNIYVNNDNMDFLHGATGLAYVSLNIFSDPKLELYFNTLLNKVEKTDEGYCLSTKFTLEHREVYDFGLAHGMINLLPILDLCIDRNIYKELAKDIFNGIFNYYINTIGRYSKKSFFPNFLDLTDHNFSSFESRLAWCYGDLGILFLLYKYASKYYSRDKSSFLLDKLKITAKRKDDIDTEIGDYSICHGSTGASIIFKILFIKTGEDIFNEASSYWEKRSMEYYLSNNVSSGVKNHSIIEGSLGVGILILMNKNNLFANDFLLKWADMFLL